MSLTRPYGSVSSDPSGLPAVESERTGWINAQFLARAVSAANSSSSSSSGGSSSGSSSWSSGHVLTGKAAKDLWRWANETGAPLRAIKSHGGKGSGGAGSGDGYYDWGRDRFGRPVADYTLTQFADRSAKRIALTALGVESRAFRQRRNRWAAIDSTSGGSGEDDVAETRKRELDEERERRRKMAALRAELYGERIGTYAQDPEWDDVVPVPAEEPDGALAAIAYPEDYAEGESTCRYVGHVTDGTDGCDSDVVPPCRHGRQGAQPAGAAADGARHQHEPCPLHGLAVPLCHRGGAEPVRGGRAGLAERRGARPP